MRPGPSTALRSLGGIVGAALLGLLAGALLMVAAGYPAGLAYRALWDGAFGDTYALADTLAAATPLILTALPFAVGVRAGLFNIGAQGQMTLGALAAAAAGRWAPAAPWPLPLFWGLLAAAVAGALWSLPAALLKVARGVHEVISTIMLNWVAFYLALYLIGSLLVDPTRAERTAPVPVASRFAPLVPGADLTGALFLAAAVALACYWFLWRLPLGYEIRVAGENPEALTYAGGHPGRIVVTALLAGGVAAGLAGATRVLGQPPAYALYGDLSNLGQLGFDGIAVALVGRNHPLGILAASVFFGALATGARTMQIFAGVPLDMIRVVHGVVILTLAAPQAWELLRRRAWTAGPGAGREAGEAGPVSRREEV